MLISSVVVHLFDEDDDPERSRDGDFRAVAADRLEGARPELNVDMDRDRTDIPKENVGVSMMSN